MVLTREYRICMPLTLEEVNIFQKRNFLFFIFYWQIVICYRKKKEKLITAKYKYLHTKNKIKKNIIVF